MNKSQSNSFTKNYKTEWYTHNNTFIYFFNKFTTIDALPVST